MCLGAELLPQYVYLPFSYPKWFEYEPGPGVRRHHRSRCHLLFLKP